MQIAITGGTGFVSQGLIPLLLQDPTVSIKVFTRNSAKALEVFKGQERVTVVVYDPLQPEMWASQLLGTEAIINLMGEPLAGTRWTPQKKHEIRQSRLAGTRGLVAAIESLSVKPKVMISSSAVGYYGPQSDDEALTESSSPGHDFLAQLSVEWEAAAQPVSDLGVRLVVIRTGIVLDLGGGALAQMLGPFQAFVGGPIGNGQQWLSWIHRQDLARLIQFALVTDSVSGVLNATAPTPVRMAEFCQTLGQVIGRPSWLPVPSFVLELAFGEAAQVILTGQRVIPARAEALGFQFNYPTLKPALQTILVN